MDSPGEPTRDDVRYVVDDVLSKVFDLGPMVVPVDAQVCELTASDAFLAALWTEGFKVIPLSPQDEE